MEESYKSQNQLSLGIGTAYLHAVRIQVSCRRQASSLLYFCQAPSYSLQLVVDWSEGLADWLTGVHESKDVAV